MERKESTELKLETFEFNAATEWENTLIIDPHFYADCDDILIQIHNKHRVTDSGHISFSEELKTVDEVEMTISKEQARTLINFLSQFV